MEDRTLAREFFAEVEARLHQCLLHPGERFAKLMVGVVAHTSVDAHGDRLTLGALQGMEESTRRRILWMRYQHDPALPIIGRTIEARVVREADGNHALLAVMGVYDTEAMPTAEALGLMKDVSDDSTQMVDEVAPAEEFTIQLGINPRELDLTEIAKLVDKAPELSSSAETTLRWGARPRSPSRSWSFSCRVFPPSWRFGIRSPRSSLTRRSAPS